MKSAHPTPRAVRLFFSSMVLGFVACSGKSDLSTGVTDTDESAQRPEMGWMDFIPDPPDGGFQLQTPIYKVPPYTEIFKCYWGTWEQDMAVNWFEWFQDPVYGHHMRMDRVGESGVDVSNGDVFDCSDAGLAVMADTRPFFNATEAGLVTGRMNLGDDMGVVIYEGEQWVIQSHFINPTDQEIWVQDTMNVGWIPLEGMDKPVSTWTFDKIFFELPPQEVSEITFTCTWPQDVFVTMFMVHMHDRALSFNSRVQQEDLSWEPWHEIPVWDPQWYESAILEVPEEPISFKSGQVVEGTCRIDNDTDYVRTWPDEMCIIEGLAYPMLDGTISRFACDQDYPG